MLLVRALRFGGFLIISLGAIALVNVALENVARAAKPRVSLEIVTRKGVSASASHEWYQKLTDLGIDGLRIRSGTGDEKPSVEETGSDAAPAQQVVGILTPDGTLHLPGGKFSQRDAGRLRDWLNKLGSEGAESVTEPAGAFGLSARQLEQVQGALKTAVTRSTKGQNAAQVVSQIGKLTALPMIVSPKARQALASVTIKDELQGFSAGTALAVILRPAGLALEPRRSGREVQLLVGTPGKEYWPPGWQPEETPIKTVPGLFEFVNVEISETPVAETVDAIAGRLKLPVLYDRNALARHKIDPTQVNGDMPGKKLSYGQVLNRVLAQAGLQYDLRVDETQRPFLWITTVKK